MGRAQDPDLHGLGAGALEFPNPGVDLAQLAGRDDILTGLDGRRRARFREPRPAADHAGRDVELTTELGQGLLPAQNALDRCSLNSVLNARLPSAFRGCSLTALAGV